MAFHHKVVWTALKVTFVVKIDTNVHQNVMRLTGNGRWRIIAAA